MPVTDPDAELVAAAMARLRSIATVLPATAITLGSGQGGIVEAHPAAWAIPFDELPGGRAPTAFGHAGRLSCRHIDGCPVLVLEGRTHLYEGACGAEVTRFVRILAGLGVQRLVLTNAAGGLHPDYEVGDLVVLADVLDLTFRSAGPCSPSRFDRPAPRPPLFDPSLTGLALIAARKAQIRAHTGVYVGVTGPNYETRAEWRAYRRLGGDVIGMSTVLEAQAASRLGLRVLGISTVTNCCRPDAPERTDGVQVVAAASRAGEGLRQILAAVLAAN